MEEKYSSLRGDRERGGVPCWFPSRGNSFEGRFEETGGKTRQKCRCNMDVPCFASPPNCIIVRVYTSTHIITYALPIVFSLMGLQGPSQVEREEPLSV